jgi:hypothetical protein
MLNSIFCQESWKIQMQAVQLRAGLDQESRPIFPLQTLKSGSLIGRRIEANPDEFRLGVKAITKY